MKKIFILLALALPLITFSCKDPEVKPDPEPEKNGKIHLKMNITANNQPLEFQKIYSTGDGQEYSLELLKFYLSGIKLVKEDGTIVNVKDIVFVDTDVEIKEPFDKDAVGKEFTFEVPAAKYKSLQFGVGVPEEMNVVKNDYDNGHPLSIYRGTDWSWAGYRFLMIRGKARNGSSADLAPFEYHIVTNQFFREAELNKSIEISGGQTSTVVLNLPIDKIFRPADATQNIDLVTENITHSDGSEQKLHLAGKVSSNFAKAIEL